MGILEIKPESKASMRAFPGVKSRPKRLLFGLGSWSLMIGSLGFVAIMRNGFGGLNPSDFWRLPLCLALVAIPLALIRERLALILGSLMYLIGSALVAGVFWFFTR